MKLHQVVVVQFHSIAIDLTFFYLFSRRTCTRVSLLADPIPETGSIFLKCFIVVVT